MTGRLIVFAALITMVVVEVRALSDANRACRRLADAEYAVGYVDGVRRLGRPEVDLGGGPGLRLVSP